MNPVRLLAAALIVGTLACSSRQSVPLDFISETAPPTVQLSDGHRIVDVSQPRVTGDSVRGVVNGSEVAIPLRRVQSVTTVRFSGARTALLVGGIAAVGSLVAYVMSTNGEGELEQCDYDNPNSLSDLCRINR